MSNKGYEQVGLSNMEVQKRIEANAINRRVKSQTRTTKEIIKSNVLTYFNLVFAILALLLIIVGAWSDLLFLPIIIANTCIGIIQEVHSKHVLDRLNIIHESKITVLREGRYQELPSDKLVLDDIIQLKAGQQIPADATMVEGMLKVNESLLTGEADEVEKGAGDVLLSGSFVVSGTAKAHIIKVGKDAYASQLLIEATSDKKEEQSEMIRSLNRLIKVVGIILIPISITLFVQSFFLNGGTFKESIAGMVAAVIGMVPEGLYLLSSVAMAASTVRLAKKKVLIHDMKCIETLARVDVLCVDKTGTITEPGMQLYNVEYLGDFQEEYVKLSIQNTINALPNDNDTMQALQNHFGQSFGGNPIEIFPFSSATKYSGVRFMDESFVIGAPEFVLRQKITEYQDYMNEFGSMGYRVLVFGKYQGVLSKEGLVCDVIPMAFLLLSNPIRKGAKETFAYFAENDVEIKVISGDNPITVSAIAKEAGIKNAHNYVDARNLESDVDFADAVERYTIFGRVTPKQKERLVLALKSKKKTVAMTGDGVNDVLALKKADCSIAMASGSDAASNVSQLVLLDSDFSRMPSVVAEGRRVVNNIQKTASLYIVKNIFSMLLAVFSMILMLDYPLEPSQISLISLFTIGIPSFILALEPNTEKIKGHFFANVLVKALPAGITDFLVVSGLIIFCREFRVDLECLSTSCTILVAIVGFMILYRIAKPMKALHICMMIGLVCGWLFCMLFVSHLFAITSISKQCAMLMIVFALITEPALRYLSLFVEKIYLIVKKIMQ